VAVLKARTPQREYFETTLLPRFAASFQSDALVLNIGAGDHAYRTYFGCSVRTSDRESACHCDETYCAEAIPYPDQTIDGILCMGVLERLDDPMQALREFARVLKPGGLMLLGMPGIDFQWHKAVDRWRLTPGGAAHVVRDFTVIEEQHFDHVYHFYVVSKP
jgi:SAM-dependent methyltransferase